LQSTRFGQRKNLRETEEISEFLPVKSIAFPSWKILEQYKFAQIRQNAPTATSHVMNCGMKNENVKHKFVFAVTQHTTMARKTVAL
jgi:hypothetical protein